MIEKYSISCNLEAEDEKKFNELMKKLTKETIGKFRNADLIRLCIRFTWENLDKIDQLQLENKRLKNLVHEQQHEILRMDNKIKNGIQILQE
ncbi:hypothetical protein [Bacillus sp. CGMCC 1.16541]|uniref:hypothetical protein n=1 Tax=Bacillus sp. CGMCC 1.16541 TaxID=2185143 RepID=UPI000D726EC3|nr:hypothetical protein [Bacillus sp. CGMCC 1.16541]